MALRRGMIAGALWIVATGASAQSSTEVPPFSVRVTGEAAITARPDQVELDVAVMTRADTAESQPRATPETPHAC
jgi:uncharacterized protein YggE